MQSSPPAAKGNGIHRPFMTAINARTFLTDPPQPHRGVVASGDDLLAIRRKRRHSRLVPNGRKTSLRFACDCRSHSRTMPSRAGEQLRAAGRKLEAEHACRVARQALLVHLIATIRAASGAIAPRSKSPPAASNWPSGERAIARTGPPNAISPIFLNVWFGPIHFPNQRLPVRRAGSDKSPVGRADEALDARSHVGSCAASPVNHCKWPHSQCRKYDHWERGGAYSASSRSASRKELFAIRSAATPIWAR